MRLGYVVMLAAATLLARSDGAALTSEVETSKLVAAHGDSAWTRSLEAATATENGDKRFLRTVDDNVDDENEDEDGDGSEERGMDFASVAKAASLVEKYKPIETNFWKRQAFFRWWLFKNKRPYQIREMLGVPIINGDKHPLYNVVEMYRKFYNSVTR